MRKKIEDICARPESPVDTSVTPLATPLYTTSVWQCESTGQADALLAGELDGYVYQRERHPNADVLSEKLAAMHEAESVVVTASGMAALSTAVLSQLQHGDHVVVSNQLYGCSSRLLEQECSRLGIAATSVDASDLESVAGAMVPETKLVVVETISNPMLRVVDIAGLSRIAKQHNALLLVDNTFASPAICQPLKLGADLVLESLSKIVNGHSDVMLGMLAGRAELWERVSTVVSTWGLTSSAFDSWMCARGLATLHLRLQRAGENALQVAHFLANHPRVNGVVYPGLEDHPDHEIAKRQFDDGFGWIVTFHIDGGRTEVDRFIAQAVGMPFCPSLGEVPTTLSHPESTSHRGLTEEQRNKSGIYAGTIRLSIG
ncbi:MAG: cystathionine beta-lyase/cystathionine gamma-synthase, partial [Pirellulaceae bacterium]